MDPAHFCLHCFASSGNPNFTPKLRQNTDGLFQHLLALVLRNIGTALRGPSIPCFTLASLCHIHPIIPAPSKGKASCKHLHPEMHSESDFSHLSNLGIHPAKGAQASACVPPSTCPLSSVHFFRQSLPKEHRLLSGPGTNPPPKQITREGFSLQGKAKEPCRLPTVFLAPLAKGSWSKASMPPKDSTKERQKLKEHCSWDFGWSSGWDSVLSIQGPWLDPCQYLIPHAAARFARCS